MYVSVMGFCALVSAGYVTSKRQGQQPAGFARLKQQVREDGTFTKAACKIDMPQIGTLSVSALGQHLIIATCSKSPGH